MVKCSGECSNVEISKPFKIYSFIKLKLYYPISFKINFSLCFTVEITTSSSINYPRAAIATYTHRVSSNLLTYNN